MRSLAPPGANGTTHLIGRSGQSAAAGAASNRVNGRTARAASRRDMRYPGGAGQEYSRIVDYRVDAFHAAWQHASSYRINRSFQRDEPTLHSTTNRGGRARDVAHV